MADKCFVFVEGPDQLFNMTIGKKYYAEEESNGYLLVKNDVGKRCLMRRDHFEEWKEPENATKNVSLKQEVQLPGESIEEYFGRVINIAKIENRTMIIAIGVGFVDVGPQTTFDYLLGYLDGSRSH